MKNLIIGITGMNGSGKSLLAQTLTKVSGGTHLSVSEAIQNELSSVGVSREHLRDTANKYRQDFGGQYWLEKLINKNDKPGLLVIESIRCLDEVSFLKKFNQSGDVFALLFTTLSSDENRFRRVLARGSTKDNTVKNLEEFLDLEKTEQNEENWKQNIPACMSYSDIIFENNFFSGTTEKDISCDKRDFIYKAIVQILDIPKMFPMFDGYTIQLE